MHFCVVMMIIGYFNYTQQNPFLNNTMITKQENPVPKETDLKHMRWWIKDLNLSSMDIIRNFINKTNQSLNCMIKDSIYNNSVQLNTKNYSRDDIKARFNEPLFLFSEGGSGNTWMRILMEYITGVSTGVPFDDYLFHKIFNAEGQCHNGLLLCKAHPRWFYFSGVGDFRYVPQGNWRLPMFNRSAASTADGLVWIIRNPWHSMWSLYQLIASGFASHSHRIPKADFSVYDFKNSVWFGTTEIALVEHWKNQFALVGVLRSNRSWSDDNIVMVKYETLLDKEKRVDEILKAVKHLYNLKDEMFLDDDDYFVVPTKARLEYLSYEKLLVRIECAFEYCDNMHVEHIKRDKRTNKDEYISMNEAYLSLGIEIICNIWNSLRPLAEPFGYKQLFLDKFNCDKMNITYNLVDNINNPNWTHVQEIRTLRRRRNEERRHKKK